MKLSVAKVQMPVVQRVVVYGPPKSGKTQLASLLSEYFRLWWFDLENGMSPLMKLPAAWQERIELVKIPDTKEMPIAIETMLKVVTGRKFVICAKHGKAGCLTCQADKSQADMLTTVELNKLGPRDIVVLDSGTQLAASAMNWVMRGQADDKKPERDDWGSLKFIMEKFLTTIQQARYNFIFISHEDEVEMVDGKEKVVPVSGSRNTSRNTAKYFDHVVYCSLKNGKHVFGSATTYANSVLTGSRLDVNIESLQVPSLLPFFQHLLEFPLDEQVQEAAKAEGSAVSPTTETTSVAEHTKEQVDAPVPTAPAPSSNSVAAAALARLRAAKVLKQS